MSGIWRAGTGSGVDPNIFQIKRDSPAAAAASIGAGGCSPSGGWPAGKPAPPVRGTVSADPIFSRMDGKRGSMVSGCSRSAAFFRARGSSAVSPSSVYSLATERRVEKPCQRSCHLTRGPARQPEGDFYKPRSSRRVDSEKEPCLRLHRMRCRLIICSMQHRAPRGNQRRSGGDSGLGISPRGEGRVAGRGRRCWCRVDIPRLPLPLGEYQKHCQK